MSRIVRWNIHDDRLNSPIGEHRHLPFHETIAGIVRYVSERDPPLFPRQKVLETEVDEILLTRIGEWWRHEQ
jgi:hypothetical protein